MKSDYVVESENQLCKHSVFTLLQVILKKKGIFTKVNNLNRCVD